MPSYHKAAYWRAQDKVYKKHPPADYREALYLPDLVLDNLVNWWTRRALRKAVCTLILRNPQVCYRQLMTPDLGVHENRSWRGLLHDKKIMQCFKARLSPLHYDLLAARARLTK